MKDDRHRLEDILEAIQRIGRYAGKGRSLFEGDELIQTWVLHHLQIIGDAASRVSEAVRAAHPGVPWRQIIGMRNVLVHDYLGIHRDEVWMVVQHDLPVLKSQIEAVLKDLAKSDSA
jgi:uncharacterized protein with HEPN domain